jgi:hypothetical protein
LIQLKTCEHKFIVVNCDVNCVDLWICGFVNCDGFLDLLTVMDSLNVMDLNCGFVNLWLTEAGGAASLCHFFSVGQDFRWRTIQQSRHCKFIFCWRLPYEDRQQKWIDAGGWPMPAKILYYHWPLVYEGAVGRL